MKFLDSLAKAYIKLTKWFKRDIPPPIIVYTIDELSTSTLYSSVSRTG